MKHTKNQKRMEKLSKITLMIRKVHEEIRNSEVSNRERVGLNVEVNDLLMAAEGLHSACTYKPWTSKNADTFLNSLPGHLENQRG